MRNSSDNIIWTAELAQTPTQPPVAAGDLLLLPAQAKGQTAHSTLHALGRADGARRWQVPLPHALVSGVQITKVSKTFVILVSTTSSDLLRGQGALLALDGAGRVRWRWSLAGQRVSAPVLAGGLVCVTADSHTLISLDLASGMEQRRIPLDAAASLSAPALRDGVAYIPCRGPHLLALGLNGRSHWHFRAEGGAWLDSTPVVVGEQVVVGGSHGRLLALDRATGKLRWQVEVGSKRKRLSPLATDGERLFVGAREGVVAVAVADGRLLWTFPTTRRVTAEPVVAGGLVYAAGHDHHLYGLDAAAGTVRWQMAVARRIEYAPLVTDEVIYVADQGGVVTAVARPFPPVAEDKSQDSWQDDSFPTGPEVEPAVDLPRLRRKLKKTFSISELRDLCLDLDVDDEDFGGKKSDMVRELLKYLERRGRLPELIALCRELRPNVDW